jgi:hypothetical protein
MGNNEVSPERVEMVLFGAALMAEKDVVGLELLMVT